MNAAEKSLPTGTVTFLFTDIEGSTKLAQGHPDKWESLQQHHHAILRSMIEAHNGYVFQIIGDAFCAAFHTAKDGLDTAIQAQRAFQASEALPLRVRMGLHTGSAEIHGNEYHGYMTLARVQRVMSVAHGGQILLSNASAELLHHELSDGITLRDMKEHRLKGLLNPERLWQIVASDLQQDFSPLQSLNEIPNNLPVQLTSFVGRENEIAELKQELDLHRLVTLTGSGGTGKTRLSLQVAADLLDQFDRGVWFIELAPLTDPDLIPQTILAAIGISEQPNKTPLEILTEYLHGKKTLIVLDNCEHLVSASAQVINALLNAAPKLRIMASSRETLGVKGELSYPVPSLSLPDIKHLPVIEQLSQYEAVRLFIDRALLVVPHFAVDKDNAPHIAQICHRLDGIPLAIELAAARIKMLSVEQISKRLDDRFRLLTGGARTALPRQQTLRALIDWSYDLLTENERLLLRRLSIFTAGWTLEAAEKVCSDSDQSSANSEQTVHRLLVTDILDLLTQLINKSLVVVIAEGSRSGETRYRMLETIRQYAREKLLEAGGSDAIRDHHMAYFVKLIEEAEPEMYRSNQVYWLNKLDDELDNLRMAIEWALAKDVRSGLQLIISGGFFWEARGDIREVQSWLKQLLEQYNEPDSLRARALVIYGSTLGTGGELTQYEILTNKGLELSRAISDKQAEAFSLWGLAGAIVLQGDIERGISFAEQSLALYRSLGDRLGQANTTRFLSVNHNDLERSKSFLFESLGLYRELGNPAGIAFCLELLAVGAMWAGDFSSSEKWLDEAMAMHRQLGNRAEEIWALNNYGRLSFWQGDYEKACTYYEQVLALAEKAGEYLLSMWTRANLSYAILRQSDLQKAKEMFGLCIQRFQKANILIGVVYAIEGLASLKTQQGQVESAVQLYSWIDGMREKMADHRPPIEQASVEKDLAVIHSKMDEPEFARLSAEGCTMTMEQAIALALEN